MRKWYSIKAEAEEAEILIYDVIGDSFWSDSVSAKQFVEDLKGLGNQSLHVRINSPGGDVFDGTAIYNALANHDAPVRTTVDGIAASMASVIAMVGSPLAMPENAMLMIHDPWTLAVGNATEMRKIADVLDKTKEGLVTAYQLKSQLNRDEIAEIMSQETWYTGTEAVEKGFADEVVAPVKMAACADLPWIANRPQGLSKTIEIPSEPKGRKVAVARRRMMLVR